MQLTHNSATLGKKKLAKHCLIYEIPQTSHKSWSNLFVIVEWLRWKTFLRQLGIKPLQRKVITSDKSKWLRAFSLSPEMGARYADISRLVLSAKRRISASFISRLEKCSAINLDEGERARAKLGRWKVWDGSERERENHRGSRMWNNEKTTTKSRRENNYTKTVIKMLAKFFWPTVSFFLLDCGFGTVEW